MKSYSLLTRPNRTINIISFPECIQVIIQFVFNHIIYIYYVYLCTYFVHNNSIYLFIYMNACEGTSTVLTLNL